MVTQISRKKDCTNLKMRIIQYLQDPVLVSNIQQYFGIKLIDKDEQKNGNANNINKKQEFIIANKFWYYLFMFGTGLGDEIFYATFIPFWFWNIDGAVGRRVCMVWAIVMFIGQGVKDFLRWERPGPPVVKLDRKWALEYGMPSTHAMVGISMPFSAAIFLANRYEYYFPVGLAIATLWCSVICVSRIYLGMHTILDLIAGILLAVTLMVPLVPLVDQLDNYFVTSPTAPLLLLVVSILMIIYYPNSGKWTPTRGDTTMILSVVVGIHIAAWLNYQTGLMSPPELQQPYVIMWPSYLMLGCMILRTILGVVGVFFTRLFGKSFSYHVLCAVLRKDVKSLKQSENSLQNKHKTFVELGCKYFTCALIGFNTLYVFPQMYKLLRIERPTLYTEL